MVRKQTGDVAFDVINEARPGVSLRFMTIVPLTPLKMTDSSRHRRFLPRLGVLGGHLRHLPIESIARPIGIDTGQLRHASITGKYPTHEGSVSVSGFL